MIPSSADEWCKARPQFSQKVTRAKKEFREIFPEVLWLKAMENLLDYLVNGATLTTISHEIHKALDVTALRIVEKVLKINHLMPRWVCDCILGKKLEVLETL